jgi:hypothetical protein
VHVPFVDDERPVETLRRANVVEGGGDFASLV